jgi:hypothetical protein
MQKSQRLRPVCLAQSLSVRALLILRLSNGNHLSALARCYQHPEEVPLELHPFG